MIKDDTVLIKCNEIWDEIKGLLSIKLHSEPIYDDIYIKTKARSFNGEIYTIFLGSRIQKEGIHYTCIMVITLDYYENGSKKLPTNMLRRIQIRCKRERDNRLTDI